MEHIERAVEVAVPVEMAYHHWNRFEAFPSFMAGIESVRWLDDSRLHWVARIGEQRREWVTQITDMVPQQRIAWQSEGGEEHAGLVTFQPLGPNRTRVVVQLMYEPEGLVETIGDMLGVVGRRVETDLLCFKDFVEGRAREI